MAGLSPQNLATHYRQLAREIDGTDHGHDDAKLLAIAFLRGLVRYHPFLGTPHRGELCFGGLRYDVRLDAEGLPMLGTHSRAALARWVKERA